MKFILGENNDLFLIKKENNLIIQSKGYQTELLLDISKFIKKEDAILINKHLTLDEIEVSLFLDFYINVDEIKDTYGEDLDGGRGRNVVYQEFKFANIQSMKLEITTCYVNSPIQLEIDLSENKEVYTAVESIIEELFNNDKIRVD